ncbi:MAG TPA: DUF4157 domain-containing protein [Thermoanaerobaculia bacterium]|nr:DUF4157 domain-containing protein [Thermoanaerobaculia bacterium]
MHARELTNRPQAPTPRMRSLLQSGALQAKLAVGQPGDRWEQEADCVAESVMRMPDPAELPTTAAPAQVQRKCAACAAGGPESCAECSEEEETVRRKEAPGHSSEAAPALESQVESLRGGGQPLPDSERAFFEPRFGHDFSRVRIHADPGAAESARSLGAFAYTLGQNIAFDDGRYAPGTDAGRRLLAHELTHVVQQGSARQTVMPYRPAGSANFKVCDTTSLKEASFKKGDATKVPWIEKIKVDFSSTALDSDGDLVPKGKLSVTYNKNGHQSADFDVDVTGGKASQGLTDSGKHKVKRIEGCGYHHTSVPAADRVKAHKRGFKYFDQSSPNKGDATMSFAVFFVQGKSSGNQAIHEGSLTTGSLACVHVASTNRIQQINYHSVEGRTKVEVGYDATALKTLCCERHKAVGRMVSNPCKGQDPTKCP